jgi:hypothetical protein
LYNVLQAENNEKICNKEYHGSVNGACFVHLQQYAYKPGKSTETVINHVITLIQEAVENRSDTSSSLDIEEGSGSTSRDITKVAKLHGLGDILAMDWLHVQWQKNYSHNHRRNNGGPVAKCCMQGGILLP